MVILNTEKSNLKVSVSETRAQCNCSSSSDVLLYMVQGISATRSSDVLLYMVPAMLDDVRMRGQLSASPPYTR